MTKRTVIKSLDTDPKEVTYRDGICKLCPNHPRINHLRRHFETRHLNVKKKCEVCGKMYANLYNHMKTHTEQKICTICSTVYANQSLLELHISTYHLHNTEGPNVRKNMIATAQRNGILAQQLTVTSGKKGSRELKILSRSDMKAALRDHVAEVGVQGQKIFHQMNELMKAHYYNVIFHESYAVVFDVMHKIPQFVFEHLEKGDSLKENTRYKRGGYTFMHDDQLPLHLQPTDANYKESEFDRGHFAAAENHSSREICFIQTFFYTNVSPMYPSFNVGSWKALENYIRENVLATAKNVTIITCSIFEPSNGSYNYKTIGNNIGVPTHYGKIIIFSTKAGQHIRAWKFDHAPNPNHFSTYATDPYALAKQVGITFKVGPLDFMMRNTAPSSTVTTPSVAAAKEKSPVKASILVIDLDDDDDDFIPKKPRRE